MKKALLFLSLSIVLVLAACGGGTDVDTCGEGNNVEAPKNEEEQAPKEKTGRTVDASAQTTEAAGMKVSLGEVKIEEDRVNVGMNLQNTTNSVLMFYPDQGTAVVGDMQLDANMFMTVGTIGGDVQGGVKQEGVIEFLAPEGKTIDVNAISEIRFIFGDVTTEDFMTSEPVEFTVPVK